MGATGVDVGGTLYDVTFGDGVLGDNISIFTDSTSATLASQSLIDQVFAGFYDKSLGLNGVSAYYISATSVNVFTPFSNTLVQTRRGSSLSTISANAQITVPYSVNTNNMLATTDTSNVDFATIATWKLSATAVPEPEAYAMMLAGLGLVGFAARRQQKAA